MWWFIPTLLLREKAAERKREESDLGSISQCYTASSHQTFTAFMLLSNNRLSANGNQAKCNHLPTEMSQDVHLPLMDI